MAVQLMSGAWSLIIYQSFQQQYSIRINYPQTPAGRPDGDQHFFFSFFFCFKGGWSTLLLLNRCYI